VARGITVGGSTVFDPRVVISAGGIGSPVILRASGMLEAGYDFFFDPLIGLRVS
jgi:hypothetical protein